MSNAKPRISVFPKCWFDELCQGKMNYLDWLRMAATLEAEGVVADAAAVGAWFPPGGTHDPATMASTATARATFNRRVIRPPPEEMRSAARERLPITTRWKPGRRPVLSLPRSPSRDVHANGDVEQGCRAAIGRRRSVAQCVADLGEQVVLALVVHGVDAGGRLVRIGDPVHDVVAVLCAGDAGQAADHARGVILREGDRHGEDVVARQHQVDRSVVQRLEVEARGITALLAAALAPRRTHLAGEA